MLKEFTIRNFKSFNDETTFSMQADSKKVHEHANHIVTMNNNKLLKIASVYGPNGGGKTNLLKALILLRNLIYSQPFILKLDNYTKCVFSDDDNIELSAFFVDNNYEIGYRTLFKVNTNQSSQSESFDFNGQLIRPITPYTFIEEEIVYRKNKERNFKSFLTRDKKGNIDCPMLKKYLEFLPQIAQSKSIVTKIYEDYANNDYRENECFDIFKKLYRQINSIVVLNSSNEMSYFSSNMYYNSIRNFIKSDNNRLKLIKLLKSVDINISNISMDKRNIYFERKIGLNEDVKKIPLNQESRGTQKIFEIFIYLVMKDENINYIYLFDDMNSYLHPKLCRAIYEWFISTDNNNSQLIFNSHDILNMSKDIFRRDEIWFAYRDDNYSTKLIALSNIVNSYGEPIRKDAVYSKQYLEGKYGADPFIKKGLNWED